MTKSFFSANKKIGILGGGQLGKMLLVPANQWDLYTKVLDPDANAPCKNLCTEFVHGNYKDFDTVYSFGQDCEVITIEIEHVNTEALLKLEQEGKEVHPKPASLAIIQDKGLQKKFYVSNQFPTADFSFAEGKNDILQKLEKGELKIPFVQKSRTAGYDGKGVSIIQSESDLNLLMDTASIIESMVELEGEIAIIAARNAKGEVTCYEAVSMDFHAGANLLDLLLYPAPINPTLQEQAQQIAKDLISKLEICGVLAVEFLIDKQGKLLVNEVAPRPHNSGHQTIEGSETSQYEQHLRGILNMPLGSTASKTNTAMANLLGHPDCSGHVVYEGIDACVKLEGVHIHIYGKKQTKPFRKMGHVTVTNSSLEEAKKIAQWAKQSIQVKSL